METKRKWPIIAIAALIALFSVGTLSSYALLTTNPLTNYYISANTEGTNLNTLTVTGIGEVSYEPDKIKISLGVTTEGTTAEEATSKNAEIFAALLENLEAEGITRDSIETVWYRIYPVYSYPRESAPILVGYRTEHQILVTVTAGDISELGAKAGKVIDAAVSAGANQLYNIQFTTSDERLEQLRDEALGKAILDASSKAKIMADALEISLVGVQHVSEGGGYYPPPIREYSAEGAKVPTELLPGTLTLTASVNVVYLIG